MKKSDHLFHLIKSLSRSEKRCFKIFASRHTIGDENQYVKLFDAIDKQSAYDEKLIIKKFKGTKLANNLSSVKVQLDNLILKSLRQFKGTTKKMYDVRELMDYADILYEKGLLEHSLKKLEKAKKIALEYEFYIALDEISILEREIAHKSSNFDALQKFDHETFYQARHYRKVNNDLAEYELLATRLHMLLLRHNRTRSKVGKERYDEIMQHPLLQGNPAEQEFACQVEYHALWGTYYFLLGNGKQCKEHREKVVTLLESRPHIIHDNPKLYISHMRSLMIFLGSNRLYEEFDAQVQKIKQFIDAIPEGKKSTNLQTEIYTTIYNAKLDIDLDRGLFESAHEFAEEVKEGMKHFDYLINTDGQAVLYYNLFYVSFGNGNFHEALAWMNTLLNQSFGEVRIDIQCFARLVNIVLHHELGNYDLIDYLVKSTARFLTKKERKFRFEELFLKFARTSLNHELSKPEQEVVFNAFTDELRVLFSDRFEEKALQYFDFISWAESKVSNKSFSALMKEKSKKTTS